MMTDIERPATIEWSKPEKEIARRAYRAAYERECSAIADRVRKMAAAIKEPADMWRIHDYLTEKREETDEKYDYRYSVLLWVFGRLMFDGWVREEDLAGLSEEKLQQIRQTAEFMAGI
jgi:hypothetical protein